MKLSKSIVSLNTSVPTSYGLYIVIGFISILILSFINLTSTLLILLLILVSITGNNITNNKSTTLTAKTTIVISLLAVGVIFPW